MLVSQGTQTFSLHPMRKFKMIRMSPGVARGDDYGL